jgi:hypothetical protein
LASPPIAKPCAAGYSGCVGVVTSGSHEVSRGVSGLPSVSAARMAVDGRQAL